MIKQSDVTIIIPHLGENKEQEFSIKECLQSLIGWKGDVVVAGNGIEMCRHAIPELSYGELHNFEQGQCKAVNAVAATVNTEWLFITNDDMVYAPGWFERLTGWASKIWFPEEGKSEDILCISPKLIEPRAGAPTFEVKNFGGAGGDFRKDLWLEFAEKNMGKETIIESGFNLPFLIKKELWDLIGGYDINYDPWGSNGDSDLQAKICLAGVETYRNRNSLVYHFSQTSGTFHPDNREYWQKNWSYFIDKWGFERQGDDQKVWYSKDLIDYDKLKYHPHWEGFYVKN